MIEANEDAVGAILHVAREGGIGRVWIVPQATADRREGPGGVHLLVQASEAVGPRVRLVFQSSVERILPGAKIRVDIMEDLDGMSNPAHRESLLTMVELTDRLTDREEGRWRVGTASGSLYVFDLTHGNRTMTRLPDSEDPRGEFRRIPSADLRRDGEALRLLSIYRLQLGQPGALLIDVREDGIPTLRGTTPVVSISRIEET
ncbi:hypothetical protein AAIH25_14990 [Arthrobacter crystallopoietes]|uniref:hypothetical protein n=1 Tax=Crystallibacter crystallopoietes TaxID=37928 RepID=UPI003D1D16C4